MQMNSQFALPYSVQLYTVLWTVSLSFYNRDLNREYKYLKMSLIQMQTESKIIHYAIMLRQILSNDFLVLTKLCRHVEYLNKIHRHINKLYRRGILNI